MTKEEFQLLGPQAREDFLNSGQSFSLSSSCGDSTVEQEKAPSGRATDMGGSGSSPSSCAEGVNQTVPDFQETNARGESVVYNNPHVYAFANPVELLYFLDEEIATGVVKLHNWQLKILYDFASGILGGVKDTDPFQAIVRAANGSGKDKYVIAPCAVWLCMCTTMYASAVVTSASGVQLDVQTCKAITMLANECNSKIHPKCWKVNYRYYECLDTRSPIMCFATDEAGKAEGYHPLRFGAKFALFESEGKSVPDEIYNAQNRCTGYTHRVIVSSPGLPLGHFYDLDCKAIERQVLEDGYEKQPIDWIKYKVTAFECSHLSANYIEQMKNELPGGELGAAYKSQILAEFGVTDSMVVIPFIYVKRAINNKIAHLSETYNTGGLDLSDGGDETVLCIRNGNLLLNVIPFRFDNTEDTITFLEEKFKEHDLTSSESLIFADSCGIGKPMLNSLKRKGWKNIRFVDSRNTPAQPKVYNNRGTEVFFHSRLLLERNELIIFNDKKLVEQLAGRHYKIDSKGKHCLMSKLEQKAKGYKSPDRADAFNLCFWNYKSTFVESITSEVAEEIQKQYKDRFAQPKILAPFTLKEWANGSDSPAKRLGKRPDMSYMMSEIEQYNRNIKQLASK